MSESYIQVLPEPRGMWAVIRPGGSVLSHHASATEAERIARRERRADERVIVRDRYGRERVAAPALAS